MHSKSPVTHSNHPLSSVRLTPYYYNNNNFCQIKCCDKNAPSSSDRKFRFRLRGRAPGAGGDKWKLNDIDGTAVKETVNQWLSKTQGFFNEVTSPLVKNGHDLKPTPENMIPTEDSDDIFMAEQTIETRTPGGNLSLAAVVSIEQFSRMNGLTGLKMQKIFKALVPESVYSDARNLVEYCCFRFLSRNSSEIHPYLKEPAFRKLIFITMLAWEEPYSKGKDPEDASGKAYLQEKLVGEEAFVRVAPAISGVADRATAQSLFKALAGDDKGISFNMWSTYLDELLKVHEGRRVYQYQEGPQLSGERILCLGLSRKRPVLKWENNMAWPGKVTLTDKALYFEGLGFAGQKGAIRLDLTENGAKVEKTRVGPLGSQLFDSAISVTAGAASKTWVLEFVDLSGEMRRDVWYAFICEVIALYKFIREFGPNDGDQSVNYVFGAHKGKARAATYAINGIARLQALQFIGKLLDDPIKLAQFSFLQSVPYGDIVCQTLAVNCWGGQLVTKNTKGVYGTGESMKSLNEVSENTTHIYDVDGSVYLRKWMRSPSWASSASATFWKSSTRKGLVLSKNLVVGGTTMVEKASVVCQERYMEVEKTQATIDAAMIEGIPSNIDLFKELLLPLTSTAKSIEKLRRWEEPHVTAAFLVLAYALLFRNLLSCLFPALLMILGAGLMLLKGLREQGRLGRYFGRITIRDQPSSNTIQKIIALKEAMREVEIYLQKLNVTLLKIRTILLAGQPQVTTEVALVLLASAAALLIVPFKYIVAFFLFDLFTRELEFRRPMVERFMSMLKERWDAVPASPVVVLPYEGDETRELNKSREAADASEPESSL